MQQILIEKTQSAEWMTEQDFNPEPRGMEIHGQHPNYSGTLPASL